MSKFHSLVVSEINRETANSVSVKFEVPSHLREDFQFIAGQYITLRAHLNGMEVRRDYSICSAPNIGELRVAVKEVESGLFSKYVNRELAVGDVMDVSTPTGRFTFEPQPEAQRHYAAFVAGSGITPVLSIIKSILTQETSSTISVIYGNKTVADTMFYDDLVKLNNTYSERLKIQFVFSQAQETDALFGRIDNSTANYFINNELTHAIDTYYICGPEEMIYLISDLLKAKNVDSQNIKFELFTIPLENEDENEISEIAEGKTKVTVMLDDEESTFVMDNSSTVLDAALAEGIDAPYSCQGGICSSCLARITEGEVKMRQNNILTDAEVAEGLVLACQSQPVTPEIYVDWDDI